MDDLHAQARALTAQLTLEEKALLCSGRDAWHLRGTERLGLAPQMVCDGPHGLRKLAGAADHLGLSESVPATCFPTASAAACSFDEDLLRRVGEALGDKCLAEDVSVLLGPGVNMKRSPLCGRNFEYFSEDPYLAGRMAAAWVSGVQSRGVGVSLKHFACNNQESYRMVCDSVVDERALREIYLTAFETVVKRAQPWTVMCRYNRLNGVFSSDNRRLLTDILRGEWGFDGLVMSDWGAVNDRAAGIRAGLDLEMPGNGPDDALPILEAVRAGTLREEELDGCVCRVIELILKAQTRRKTPRTGDQDHHALAREAACKSAVLLKNEGVLPLAKTAKAAFLGRMAKQPRYQGAGSSRINPTALDSAFDAAAAAGLTPLYAPGYDETGAASAQLLAEAAAAAAQADVCVVFAGLPDSYESEGFDRTTLDMPAGHNALIEAAAAANPNTVVVLQCGAPVLLPWRDRVRGILLQYLSGQAGGAACVDLLYGAANPGGKLAETWPLRPADVPASASFPGDAHMAAYRESIFIGYRYYDAAACEPAYPFGYGLSYTQFAYADLCVTPAGENAFTVTAKVKNTGGCAGSETAQLYVGFAGRSALLRAPRTLAGFAKVTLAPGEEREVRFALDARSFAYYNKAAAAWCIEGGSYEIAVGGSSRTLPLRAAVTLPGDGRETLLAGETALTDYAHPAVPFAPDAAQFAALLGRPLPAAPKPGRPYTSASTMGDVRRTVVGHAMTFVLHREAKKMRAAGDAGMAAMMETTAYESPLRSLRMFTNGQLRYRQIAGIVAMANRHFAHGLRLFFGKSRPHG